MGALFRPLPFTQSRETIASNHDIKCPSSSSLAFTQITHESSGNKLDEPFRKFNNEKFMQIKEEDGAAMEKECSQMNSKQNFCNTLSKKMGFYLLRNIEFCLFNLLMTGCFLAASVSGIFLSKLGEELLGLTSLQTTFIIIISSFVEILGRLTSGFIFDLKCINKFKSLIIVVISLLYSFCSVLITFSNSVVMMLVISMLLEFFFSIVHAQYLGVLRDIVGINHVTLAIGLMRFSMGFGVLGPVIGGVLKDKFGSYVYAYYFSGSLYFVFTILYGFHGAFIKGQS